MKKNALAVLLFGGLWGISEATVGYLAHLLFPGMGWMFYYPLAYGFMRGAYKQTGKSSVVFLCGLLSAAIKLINLPITPRLDYVINPAVSIVLEGLTLSLAFRWICDKNRPMVRFFLLPFLTSAAWRGLYLLYLLLAPDWIREISVLYQPEMLMNFATLELLGTGLIIALWSIGASLLMKYHKKPFSKRFANGQGFLNRSSGDLAIASVCLAVLLQWIF